MAVGGKQVGVLFIMMLALAILVMTTAAADEEKGVLRGEVTLVGQDYMREGEVVVSFRGTDSLAGSAGINSTHPTYAIHLDPGEYSAYSEGKPFHRTPSKDVTITANTTTWMNFTLVRIEELFVNVTSEDGSPLEGATIQFYSGETLFDTSTTDDGGAVRMLIDPGEYTVTTTKSGHEADTRDLTVEPGQVQRLDIQLVPVPEEEEEDFPWVAVALTVFIVLAVIASVGYMGAQARRVRRAKLEAEARRARESLCPECGAVVPEASKSCPGCGHVFQVRCPECGRAVDAGTEECPECGTRL